MVEDIIEDPLVMMEVEEPLLRPLSFDLLLMMGANLCGLAVVGLLVLVGRL